MAKKQHWLIEFWKSLPTPVKVVVVGGTIYGGYRLVKRIGSGGNYYNQPGNFIAPVTNNYLTFAEDQYKVYSDALFIAMDTSGTDEDGIVNIFSLMKTDADIEMLIKKFGVRFINFFGIFGGADYNLPSALRSELSEYYINLINADLEQKGIKWKV